MDEDITRMGSANELFSTGKTLVISERYGLELEVSYGSDRIIFKLIKGELSSTCLDGGPPLSVYCNYSIARDNTVHTIIKSKKPSDSSSILDLIDLNWDLNRIIRSEWNISDIVVNYISNSYFTDGKEEFYILFELYNDPEWNKIK